MPNAQAQIDEFFKKIKELIEKSRTEGFDSGYEVGYQAGTDWAITAFSDSVKALSGNPVVDVDKVRTDLGLSEEPTPIVEEMGWVIQQPAKIIHKKRIVSVKALGLSTKTQNALTNNKITKVKQLTEMSAADLRKLPRIGAGAIEEIVAALKERGLSLRD